MLIIRQSIIDDLRDLILEQLTKMLRYLYRIFGLRFVTQFTLAKSCLAVHMYLNDNCKTANFIA